MSDIEFAQAYSFKYSSRPGTPASGKVEVDEQLKSDRLESLQQLLNAQQLAFNLKSWDGPKCFGGKTRTKTGTVSW